MIHEIPNGPQLFQGGSIATESDREAKRADLLVEDGVIIGIGPALGIPEGAEVIDCSGKILLPGLFDMLVHLREPGREDEETIQSGTEAAIAGGFTGILTMPNTDPPIDSAAMVRFVQSLARENARIPVQTAGCISKGRLGKEMAEIGDMHATGARLITDDGSSVQDPNLLLRAMQYARSFDMLVGSHCETPMLNGEGVMNLGSMSYKLGVPGMPAISEEICIERDIRIAQHAGARIHIQQVTTSRGLEIIRRFKNEGVAVTAEVSPHHLLFNEEHLAPDYNTSLKMNPPLRTEADSEALLEGLIDGSFDVIATDHAPHSSYKKNMDFMAAPFGILGLETALLSLFDRLIKPGRLGWDSLVRAYAKNPRTILGLDEATGLKEGASLNLVIFDPEGETQITRESLQSQSHNTPWLGKTLAGNVESVWLGKTRLI